MSEFFKDGDEFLRYMKQMVADMERYNPIPFDSLAEGSLIFHRAEATRLGCDPDRDPMSGKWTVLIPSEQFSAGLDEVFSQKVEANTQVIATLTHQVEASEIEMHLPLGVMLKNRGVAENI